MDAKFEDRALAAGRKPSPVLLISLQFPPSNESSGHQRVLSFARYLPAHDWQPLVLTAHPRAYGWLSNEQMRDIPPDLVVRRAFALDARKHLSIRNSYPQLFAIPDRWSSWWLGAVPAGLAMVRRYRPKVLLATYPFATAMLVGLTLQRLTGLPLIADFRDPMNAGTAGSAGLNHRVWRWLEQAVVRSANKLVFTTAGAAHSCAERYRLAADLCAVIPNGYDEKDFEGIDQVQPPQRHRPLMLLHSGVLYKGERDPRPLFEAVARLRREGHIAPERLQIVFRGCGTEAYFRDLAAQTGVADVVRIEPRLGYRAALREMCSVDGLLVIQGSRHNNQVPAKVYEYMRTGRPIFALTDVEGNTAATLRTAGIDTLAPADDAGAIAAALVAFIAQVTAGSAPVVRLETARRYSRAARAAELAQILEQVCATDDAWCRAAR